jgi:hypothetical protein
VGLSSRRVLGVHPRPDAGLESPLRRRGQP